MQQVNDYIRKHARQFMKDLKTRKLNGAGLKLSATDKKKLWAYADDEVEIAPDASWDRVQSVLEYVGNAASTQRSKNDFHHVRSRQKRTHPVKAAL